MAQSRAIFRIMTRRSLLTIPVAAFAQRGGYAVWSWDRWREITNESKPTITSVQSGKAQLSDLPAQRAQLSQVIDVFLGAPPKSKPPLEAATLDEVTLDDGVVRRNVRFQSEPGESIPAFLFLPAKRTARMPAVVCPHQTVQDGKNEPAGISGNPNLNLAIALARRGYVTVAYDAACFGERHDPATGHYGEAIEFYRRHSEWSMMGKMAWDLSRAVDYLIQLDFVDASRIGSIGHSHGGYTTWFAMALDNRINAGVSSCGFDTFRHDGNPFRWSHATALIPRLGFYVTSPHINMRNYSGVPDSETINIPFDMHWVIALIAPRALMLTASDDDNIFPNSGWSTRQAEARLRPFYDRLETFYFKGGHGFPAASRERAFAFLSSAL